jgi:hypothetical protein
MTKQEFIDRLTYDLTLEYAKKYDKIAPENVNEIHIQKIVKAANTYHELLESCSEMMSFQD